MKSLTDYLTRKINEGMLNESHSIVDGVESFLLKPSTLTTLSKGNDKKNVKDFIENEIVPWFEDIWTDAADDAIADGLHPDDDFEEIEVKADENFIDHVTDILKYEVIFDQFEDGWKDKIDFNAFRENFLAVWKTWQRKI